MFGTLQLYTWRLDTQLLYTGLLYAQLLDTGAWSRAG